MGHVVDQCWGVPVRVVEGASTGSHEGEAGEFLWVMVEHRDGASVADSPVTMVDERNDDPATPADSVVETDHDSDEMLHAGSENAVQAAQAAQSAGTHSASSTMTVDLEVAENTPGTGYAGIPVAGLGIRRMTGALDSGMFVFAEDHDARDDGFYDEALAPMEDMDDKADQLALMPGIHLDYEGASNSYVLELPVADGGEATEETVTVNITVTDVNEPPSAPQRSHGLSVGMDQDPRGVPVFSAATTTRTIAENTPPGAGIGGPVPATHDDPQETLRYSLGGEDAGFFDIATTTGQLLTRQPLDFETRDIFLVEVTATDTAGATATTSVTVRVTNVGLDTRYDTDDSGTIERDEILRAVRDYFAGGPGAPTRDEILELVSLYLDGGERWQPGKTTPNLVGM